MAPAIDRRQALRLLGSGAAAAGLAGCGAFGSPSNRSDKLTLWYWDRSVSDDFLAAAPKHVPGLQLSPYKIGINFRTKVLTTLAGHAYAPDITCINSDIATYFPDQNAFLDLNSLGARELSHQYLDWKWRLGTTAEGKQIGYPTDTGPTALMYRMDTFKRAGLPTDPDEVAPLVSTWDRYLELGTRLRRLHGTYLTANVGNVYTISMSQSPKQYLDKDGRFIGDQDHVRTAWDRAVKARRLGLSARIPDGAPDWNAGVTSGSIAAVHNAAWEAFVIAQTAGSTSGKWRVCPGPGGAGNSGGSFMAITKYCRNPELAFAAIKWLQSPANQTKAYTSIQLFPSTVASLTEPAVTHSRADFFGGQPIGEVFSAAARSIKPAYYSPYDNIVSAQFGAQLSNVESAGKDPDRAWDDAVSEAKRQLKHIGVSV